MAVTRVDLATASEMTGVTREALQKWAKWELLGAQKASAGKRGRPRYWVKKPGILQARLIHAVKQKVGNAIPHFRKILMHLDLKSGVPQAVQLRTNFVGKLYVVLAAEKDAKVLVKMSGVEKEKVLVFDPVAEMRRIDEEFQAMDRP